MEEDVPPDVNAKRTRDLLSSYYVLPIDGHFFDPDEYMKDLVNKSDVAGLLQTDVQLAQEIEALETALQKSHSESSTKFLSAIDAIKQMKNNIVDMDLQIRRLEDKISSMKLVTSRAQLRKQIEKCHRALSFLRKLEFIYDLPVRLRECIKSGAYADAVKFYTGAMPIFKAYGDASFQDCKRASEEAVRIIIKNLQEKLSSDSESIQAKADAAMLLQQLNHPVCTAFN